MQTALLGLGVFPPPPARSQVLSDRRRAGARSAPDAAVSLVLQRVVGHCVFTDVLPDFGFAPIGQRVEFPQLILRVVFALGQVPTGDCLRASHPGYPGLLAGKRTPQGLDLADLAASLA